MENKQLKLGAAISYLSIALNLLSGLIYTPWMIQQIGQSQYGLYTLANSLITLFIVDFGLSSATARYLSKYHAEGREEKAQEILGAIYKLYLLIDAIVLIGLVIVYFFIDNIYSKLTPNELLQFKVVYIIAASFSVINLPFVTLNGVLTAYEKFIPLKSADVIYRLLIIASTAIALVLGGGLYAIVAVQAIVGIIVILFKLIAIRRTVPIKAKWGHNDKSLYKEIMGFSLWTTVATLAQRLIFNITPSILGITANTAAIAVFGVVTTMESNTFTITSAINGMFMPKISRIYSGTDNDKSIMPLMISVGKFQFSIMSIIIVGFALLGKSFINLWMGEQYSVAYYGILLVILPCLIYNSLQIANTALTVQKKVNIQAGIVLGVGVINVILSFVFSSWWGVIGSCVSIFLAYSIRNIAYLVVHHKITGVNIPLFIKKCYFRLSVPMFGTLIFGIVLNKILCDAGWIRLVEKGFLIVLVYIVLMLLFGLSNEDKVKVFRFLKKR